MQQEGIIHCLLSVSMCLPAGRKICGQINIKLLGKTAFRKGSNQLNFEHLQSLSMEQMSLQKTVGNVQALEQRSAQY